jgi:CotS family spore coat protein
MDYIKDYPVKSKRIVGDKDGLTVYTSKSNFVLKHVECKESEIIASAAIIEHVMQKGFSNILSIKRNMEGKPYIKKEGKIFVLYQEFENNKLSLNSKENGLLFAEYLAKFHNSSVGFIQPTGVKVRVSWGKNMERYRTLICRLEKYIDYINEKEKLNKFEEYTKPYVNNLLKRAKQSMKVLRSAKYLMALEKSMKRKEICLNGISQNTAVVRGEEVIIVKVFEMGYNMVEEDVSALVKKIIEETEDKTLFDNILERYEEYREGNCISKDIVKALVSYPVDSIKIIGKYLKDMEDSEELLEKFKKYMKYEQRTDLMEV